MSQRIAGAIAVLIFTAFVVACAAPSGEGTYDESQLALKPIPKVDAPYDGQTVVVAAFASKSLSGHPSYGQLGSQATEYLAEFLIEAGFQPLEGSSGDLDTLIGELKYNDSGMVDTNTAVEAGKHAGARYVVTGAVTDYREVDGKGSQGLNVMGFGLGGAGGYIEYYVQASARIVDIETRKILGSKTSTFKQRFDVKGGAVQTPWFSGNKSEEITVKNQTGGRILQLCLNQLMIDLVSQLNTDA